MTTPDNDADDIIDRLKYTDEELAEQYFRKAIGNDVYWECAFKIYQSFDTATKITLYKRLLKYDKGSTDLS